MWNHNQYDLLNRGIYFSHGVRTQFLDDYSGTETDIVKANYSKRYLRVKSESTVCEWAVNRSEVGCQLLFTLF